MSRAKALRRAAWIGLGLMSAILPDGTRAEQPLALEAKIPLGAVRGRIDHFAIDVARQRLFVAELGNDSVGVVDLRAGKVAHRLTGLKHPQGLAYSGAADRLFVANAGDGSVQGFGGADLKPVGSVVPGPDADNLRLDAATGHLYVGYGEGAGAIARLDPRSLAKLGEITVKAHPESFQLDAAAGRIYANIADAAHVAVLDINAGRQIAEWKLPNANANFPMALDPARQRVLVVTRQPPRLVAYDAVQGSVLATLPVCGDADDVFVDGKRRRLYVSCGEGVIDVLGEKGETYQRLARLRTVFGARTALFVPELDRLYLAVRASGDQPPAIWVYRPQD